MKRGAAIKYVRTKKGLKQKELVSSVHSKSLISRIENDDSEVHDGHYNYFIEKLDVDFPVLLKKEEKIGESIENLLTNIHYLQLEEAESVLNQLIVEEEFIKFSEHHLIYLNMKFYFYIQTNDMVLAETIWIEIQKHAIKYLSRETALAEFFYAVYLVFKGDFKRADDRLSKILINETQKSFVIRGDLYFYASKAKAALKDYHTATYLAGKAAGYYNTRFNYKRSIMAAELLISCHISTEMYDDALKLLKNLLRHKEILKLLPNELPIIYHLLGSVYKKTGQFDMALDYYRQSLEFAQPKDVTSLLMQFNYCNLLFKTNNGKTKEQFSKLYLLSDSLSNFEYSIIAKFYLLLLDDEIKAIDYIENKFKNQGYMLKNSDAKSEIYSRLFNYYKDCNIVDKAMFYLEKWKEGEKC